MTDSLEHIRMVCQENLNPQQSEFIDYFGNQSCVGVVKEVMKLRHTPLVLSVILGAGIASAQQDSKPNILLIIADDYGKEDAALYNSNPSASLPNTPVIDALGRTGTIFSNTYAYPVCSPTRAAMLTGRFGFRTGIANIGFNMSLPRSETTLPEIFNIYAPEYALASFGKWHLGEGLTDPNQLGGWPHFQGSLPGSPSNYYNWEKVTNGTAETSLNYNTTEIVDDFLAWAEAVDGVQPWFAWVGFCAPHTPLHAPPEHLHSKGPLLGTNEDINENPRLYFEAMVEAMDTEIGRLLSSIDLENVVIIFIGDNGTDNSVAQEYMLSGANKDSLYEGGVKVPMIIKTIPVVAAGSYDETETEATSVTTASIVNDPVHVLDLFSTILEIAEIEDWLETSATVTIDSRSVLPLLRAESSRESVYGEIGYTQRTGFGGVFMRDQRYKLIQSDSGDEEFYDLLLDPYERNDLLSQVLETELSENQKTALEFLRTQLESYR